MNESVMDDRTAELRALAEEVREHEQVADAWLAKSFTDQLFVVDVAADESLPESVESRLAANGLRGANEVYGTGGPDTSFMGGVGEGTRHQFVDVRTRGDHQSYVLE